MEKHYCKRRKTQYLDFTHIEDLTEGVISIINSKNSLNQVFNLTYLTEVFKCQKY